MKRLIVLYDEHCPICIRCRDWLDASSQLVPLTCVASGSSAAREAFGTLPWLGHELVVVSDEGHVWAGPAAFLVCFWALARYRWLALLASSVLFIGIAESIFTWVSSHRGTFGEIFFDEVCEDGHCGIVPRHSPYR